MTDYMTVYEPDGTQHDVPLTERHFSVDLDEVLTRYGFEEIEPGLYVRPYDDIEQSPTVDVRRGDDEWEIYSPIADGNELLISGRGIDALADALQVREL